MSESEQSTGVNPPANDAAASALVDGQAPERAGRPIESLPPRKDGIGNGHQKSDQPEVTYMIRLKGPGAPPQDTDERAELGTNKEDGEASVVLPKKRIKKPGPKVNVLASGDLSGGDRPENKTERRKPLKLELHELGKVEKRSWRIHLPKFREISDTTTALAEALRIHRDVELSDWKRSGLPNWKWLVIVLLFVSSVIMGGHLLTYGIPNWVKTHILGREIKPERPVYTSKMEVEMLEGGMRLPPEQMKVFIAEVDQLLKSSDEAMKHFADFASLNVSEDVLYFIRKQDGVETLVREHGAPNLAPKGWKPDQRSNWNVRTTATKPYALLSGALPNGEPYFAYFIIENGQLVMDWKATTAYSSASLEQLVAGEGDGSEIRGWLMPDTYFNGVYKEGKYHCYRWSPSGNEGVVWCYTLAGTPIANEMVQRFHGGGIVRNRNAPVRVTIRIKKADEQAMPNQWLIDEFLGDDWLQL